MTDLLNESASISLPPCDHRNVYLTISVRGCFWVCVLLYFICYYGHVCSDSLRFLCGFVSTN